MPIKTFFLKAKAIDDIIPHNLLEIADPLGTMRKINGIDARLNPAALARFK